LSCKADKWSSVREFLDVTLKKINAKSDPDVCHPMLRKFKAASVNKVASCSSLEDTALASSAPLQILVHGSGFCCRGMASSAL